MSLSTIILAAGQGTRMHSDTPKVLHHLAGKPLLQHVIDTAEVLAANQQTLVVHGHQGEAVKQTLSHTHVTWVSQREQLGTGHAVLQALPALGSSTQVLILYGDVPLITAESLADFIKHTPKDAVGLITANVTKPQGLGRILRNDAKEIVRIVEEKDASANERLITEINSGIYLIPTALLNTNLPNLTNTNAQGEYYLTDIVTQAVSAGIPVVGYTLADASEALGINDRAQLATAERLYQLRLAHQLLMQGVTLADPARLDIRGLVKIGRDVSIDVGVILEGDVVIGDRCHIGAHSLLRNTHIAENTHILPYSFLEGANIGPSCHIGPYARIRPGTIVQAEAHIGNFIEIKNSTIGVKTKIHHLGYIGDSDIGTSVNIGAGTITCNYDGVNKHRTHIGDQAFIGSSSQLIAPVSIGTGAYIGAGSTITRDAPPHQLTLCRTPQRSIADWKRREKKES